MNKILGLGPLTEASFLVLSLQNIHLKVSTLSENSGTFFHSKID